MKKAKKIEKLCLEGLQSFKQKVAMFAELEGGLVVRALPEISLLHYMVIFSTLDYDTLRSLRTEIKQLLSLSMAWEEASLTPIGKRGAKVVLDRCEFLHEQIQGCIEDQEAGLDPYYTLEMKTCLDEIPRI
ncbi:MAG: hypothetical protein ACR2OR_08940 [Hyphomicrobiales bacterium]